jgi:group I intron endonuclease
MPYVYETSNLLTNKKYIGYCSKTPETSKSYLGSGSILNTAIKKYGKENFQKTILKEFDNNEEARLYEEYLIDKYDAVNSLNYYNLTKGGFGGWSDQAKINQKSLATRKKISESQKGKIVSAITREKLSKTLKGTKPWNTGIPRSEETKKKLSKALLGKRITQEHKDTISKAQKGREYQISTCPHCNKSGGVNVMQRWHFKNCKIQHA